MTQVAAEGFGGTPSIPTYVLGLGLSLTNLHSIAMAGGTSQAFIVDPNSGTALAQAMNQIRGAALPCDYALPKNTTDPRKVNIDFTPQGGMPTRLVHVGAAANCDPVKGGWYYDNPQMPSRHHRVPADVRHVQERSERSRRRRPRLRHRHQIRCRRSAKAIIDVVDDVRGVSIGPQRSLCQ